MSWRSHGTSNDTMVEALERNGIVKTKQVADAMRAVDRGLFVREKGMEYADTPTPIGHNATISAPHMHAYCLEFLKDHLKPGARVLDVGSGTGYLTACFAHMVCNNTSEGVAVGIEHIPELTARAITDVQRSSPSCANWMNEGRLVLITGDGREGYASKGPYDAIHVGAAAPTTPEALIQQLAPGGRMMIPVGTFDQSLDCYDKGQDGKVTLRHAMGVRYVRLTSKQEQISGYR